MVKRLPDRYLEHKIRQSRGGRKQERAQQRRQKKRLRGR